MAKLDDIRVAIEQHGERRRAALKAADEELAAIADLVPPALRAGATVSEIGRLGAVSRPTLYAILEERGVRR